MPRIALCAILSLSLGACTTYHPVPKNAPSRAQPVIPQTFTRSIKIVSEPMGARIEVNDEFVGVTPLTLELPCDGEGMPIERVLIRAMPTQVGGYCQIKFFRPTRHYNLLGDDKGNRLPERIFFDMGLAPSFAPLF
jgi:hypothetical protein